MSDRVRQIMQAMADPDAPWYGSDLVSWVGDLIDEVLHLRSSLRNIIDQDDVAEARVIASTALHDPYSEVSDE